jgi:cell division septum initiation protein DivIVA
MRAGRLSQAEEEARRIVAEAEAEAQRIREAARNAVWELEDNARRRIEHVVADARVLEDRVEWARDGLREVVARLQQIASQRGAADESEERPGEDRPS